LPPVASGCGPDLTGVPLHVYRAQQLAVYGVFC